MHKIITICREFGSGGREVGKRLAETLNYSYYDKELISHIAEKIGLDSSYIEKQSEQYSIRTFPYSVGRAFMSYNQPALQMNIDVQVAQQNIIKEIACKEDAIIIGRCADYILSEYNPLKVFIYASDIEYKVNRCYDKVPSDKSKSIKEMTKEILAIDKKRSKYYEQYTGNSWADKSNYNLCIDTSKVGIKGAVDIILTALNNI